VSNPKNERLADLTTREWFVIAPVAAMAIFMGVVPNLFLRPMEPAVERMVQRVQATQVRTVESAPAPVPPPGAARAGALAAAAR
jgi:NADH-quinone oxidoreductase subunit M